MYIEVRITLFEQMQDMAENSICTCVVYIYVYRDTRT